MIFTFEEIVRATGGEISGKGDGSVAGVSTDSRTVSPRDLFIALKGERFDGHDFIPAVAGKGVRAFVVEKSWLSTHEVPCGSFLTGVSDTLRALGDLATFHRDRFSLPVVGITGSNGKTTTKEMLADILAAVGRGLKTSGNLNNLIGLPRMLLQLDGGHNWAVLEMGMSELGEIDRLAEIAKPDIGVITNALPAHLETLGSVETVARAKGELFLRLSEGGCAVFNADDPLISGCPSPEGVKRLSFGIRSGDIRAEKIENLGKEGQTFTLCLPSGAVPVYLKAFGLHNIYNALAAAAAAFALDVNSGSILAGLESFTPYDKRFSVEECDGITLIDDSYNANPGSMKAALETLRGLKGDRRGIAVLGDMLELGESSVSAHEEIGMLAASCVEKIYVIGEMAEPVAKGALNAGLPPASVSIASDHEELLAQLLADLDNGDHVLVKGSRGMKMETVAEGIRNLPDNRGKKGALA
ncbi:MAG TPA: UDP-N-acetylmuramoyl-tripeptide--D-alanyl-D-alanine ligase [Geobacteraceae bacterium]|nr:UDP-N-acetylmuramoyl-tripeptide--D-alanyl-D-alanine ligase [Geobacteraceae bacterium]